MRRWRSKGADGNSSTESISGRKDKYIGDPDGNLCWIFFGREHFEMGPGKKRVPVRHRGRETRVLCTR